MLAKVNGTRLIWELQSLEAMAVCLIAVPLLSEFKIDFYATTLPLVPVQPHNLLMASELCWSHLNETSMNHRLLEVRDASASYV